MRRKDREVTNLQEILNIVDKAKILHLGLFDAEYPYVVPLHFGYEYRDGRLIFYIHAAKEGRKMDLIRKNPNVCVELDCDVVPIPGGDVPCGYGSTFASVIGRGCAEIVEDTEEKIKGLKLLMRNQVGRDFEIDRNMADAVAVIKVTVPAFTVKANRK